MQSTTFINEWDKLIEWAVENNQPGYMYDTDDEGNTYLRARTRHPAFIGAQPVKHDPERDSK